jgi:hypothetical protein
MNRSRTMRVLAVATVGALTLGPAVDAGFGDQSSSAAAASATEQASTAAAEPRRRGDPRAYKISRLGGGDGPRVGWRHCRRINYRVNYDHAPRRSRWHVQEAIRRLERATGMHFRYRGRTAAKPNPRGRGYPRGTRLVVGWDGPRNPWLTRGALGVGGWAARGNGAIVKGFVIVNHRIRVAPGFGRGPRFGVQGTRGQVLMHELAHTVGLAHVRARAQLMFPKTTRKKATWGAGDWNGLRKQGRRAGCF